MAAAAATTAATAGGDAGDDFLRVYDAVATGASEHELQRVIEECAQGHDQRRAQAVNQPGQDDETPLQAAHQKKRGDLVGALVEACADVGGILFDGRALTPLALCIAYGQVESVRALLRAGHDANEEIEFESQDLYGIRDPLSAPVHFCLGPPPLGVPSDRFHWGKFGAPQVACLKVLLREGGADVDVVSSRGETPMHWLARLSPGYDDAEEKAARDLLVSAGARASGVFDEDGCSPLMVAAKHESTRFARFLIEEVGAPVDDRSLHGDLTAPADDEFRPPGGRTALHWYVSWKSGDKMVALLLDAGANVDARDDYGVTPLLASIWRRNTAATRMLLDRGASVDVTDENGCSPLLAICSDNTWMRDEGWPAFQEILRRSSVKTRCSVCNEDEDEDEDASEDEEKNKSAVDMLAGVLEWRFSSHPEKNLRCQMRAYWAISELLASGAPVLPGNLARLLSIAAELSKDQHAEVADRLAELCSWRAHETFVGVSLDFKELRGAEREVAEKRARVAALERELRELGGGRRGTDSSSGSEGSAGGDDSESEGDEDDLE